jgi:hypothetical protein
MFEGEKTFIFWIGLIILGLASVGLFGMFWLVVIYDGYLFRMLSQAVPIIVGGVVFVLIGIYMMMSGVKRKEARRLADERPVGGVVHCFACGTPNAQDAVYCKKCGQQLSAG